MSEESKPEQQQAQSTFSFGKRLSSARGALNLSREEVAKELRLGVEVIIALEEEDYEQLGVPIFVTGYLRNYARLLRIPVEPLLAAYGQIQVEVPTLVADAARKPSPSYSKLIVKVATLLIVLVLIAGIVSWIQNQDFDFSTLLSSPSETVNEQSVETMPALPELGTPDEAPSLEPAPTASSEEPVASSPPPALEISSEPPSPPVQAESTDEVSNQALISVSEDSWVEIEDADGKRLIYELLRAGKQYQTIGKAPFKVFLGNAKAVRIEYNGEPIEVDKYRRGNLARFRLGAAGE